MSPSAITFEPSALGALRFMLGYVAIDFICTMLNRYVWHEVPRAEPFKENQE